jgi:DNA-binding NtrC family response regulator
VPPLRQRRDDISELAAYFLARHRATRDLSLSDSARDALRLYEWPGNVRELERLIERAVALVTGHRIELSDLPPQVCGRYGEVLGPSLAANDSMRAWGSRYARLMFERCGRNKRAASRVLGISYHTLEAYLRYGYASRTSGTRVPGWARSEQDPGDLKSARE